MTQPKSVLYPILHDPRVFVNLAVCLLGPSESASKSVAKASPTREFLVLGECLADGRARLYETGNVGQLEIDNRADFDLFLQAGDVVKGGRQDRTLGADFIVPAGSERMPVPAFCVEQGRWSQRRGESAWEFSGSEEYLSSSKLKLALRKEQSQSAVWAEVAAMQGKLAESLGTPVAAAASPSSLQLSMEDQRVRRQVDDYTEALGALPDAYPAAVGFVFAINGRPGGAETYGTPALFRKLWRKGLRAAAMEALSERSGRANSGAGEGDEGGILVDRATVAAWLAVPRRGQAVRMRRQAVTDRVSLRTRETPDRIVFETLDAAQDDRCVHTSILAQ